MIVITNDKCIVVLLGSAQDAGIPQIGCFCTNCERALNNSKFRRSVSSIGIINQNTGTTFFIDCTPDFRDQYFLLENVKNKHQNKIFLNRSQKSANNDFGINGIFLTHGHMGHYSGLVQLGKEAAAAGDVAVFGTKKMVKYLRANEPYKTLIKIGNINPIIIAHGKSKKIDEDISVTPFLVNHRQDFTDTVGYYIAGPTKGMIYVPDIDSITQPILEKIPSADIALIDGTFYQDDELHPRRDIRLTPHIPILESMKILRAYNKKSRIFFTHFNHTNPVVDPESVEANYVKDQGFGLASEEWTFSI